MRAIFEIEEVNDELIDAIIDLAEDRQIMIEIKPDDDSENIIELSLNTPTMYEIDGLDYILEDINDDEDVAIFSDYYANLRIFTFSTLAYYDIAQRNDPQMYNIFLEARR